MAYHLFDTDLGTCGIAWSEAGLTRVGLPETYPQETEARVRRHGGEPASRPLPGPVEEVVCALQAYFAGACPAFTAVRLDDLAATEFERSLYRELRAVPHGATTTYGERASAIGRPRAARAVGMAMGRNPWPIIVPCHRVLASSGGIGGFSATGGRTTKLKLLALEGVQPGPPALPDLFDARPSS